MSEQIKILIPAKLAEPEPRIQYGVVGQHAVIDKFTATNTTAEQITFSVHIVAKGQEIAPMNAVISNCDLAPGETCTCPEILGHLVGDGESIATSASAEGVSIRCSGRLIR